MKKLIFSALLLCLGFSLTAQENPLWLRNSAISPDGKEIAFTYKGDIFKVSSKGGKALQITSNPAHDTQPIWSPDGKEIAFASNRENSFNIYVVSADGGIAKRITYNSANEYPITYKDNNHILYTTNIRPDAEDTRFPSFSQVYEVSTDGTRPTLFSSLPMEDINFHPTDRNKFLYHDNKGYEDKFRKHHQSSITRDVWLATDKANAERKYEKITTFRGEDRTPVWSKDGQHFYYLSEESGSFNIYKADINLTTKKQLTRFDKHPVRFLTVSDNDILSFGYDGELYTLREGEEPQKVAIEIVADIKESTISHFNFGSANEMAISPNGKEVAFIYRGDVFVTSTEYKTTRKITNTPEQERSVSFSPDGRALLYAAERNGLWNIYQMKLNNKDDKQFLYTQDFSEEQLTNSKEACFQPSYSPNGKEVAYLEARTTLKVLDLKNKKSRTILDGQFNYSYADGDQWFQWSPDSKWLLTHYIGIGGWNNRDIALVKADGSKEVVNLTESGYTDANARFVQNGKAMLWFSDRAGYRSHGSWGAHMDAYIMFFDRKTYDKFLMDKEEREIYKDLNKKEVEKEEKEKAKEEKKDKKKKDEIKPKKVDDLKFELENRQDLVLRLTPNSSSLSDAYLNNEGTKLYYLSRFEKGYDLWVYDLENKSSRILVKGAGGGSLEPDKDGQHLYLLSYGQLKKITIASGAVKTISISGEFTHNPAGERQYMFDHIWKQVNDKFYVTDIHGIDWAGYKEEYAKYLPHINNNFDFAEMLSELLGELNASHTGARYYGGGAYYRPTASLGVFYNNKYDGNGAMIEEILPLGPLGQADSKIKKGAIITKIDGKEIGKEDISKFLEGKAGQRILVSFKEKKNGKELEEWVKPFSQGAERDLLYKRWVEKRRQMVEKLSNGKIGYVHVKGMDSQSFRVVYSELLGKYRNADAVIVDTRHNGGGWLHDDLATLLSGKVYMKFVPRGQFIGNDPFSKWTKPSAVLTCEDNYSNAHGFPWLYKELGIGKLIGTPVPGTMTAVWWENQIDPSIVFGIPQVAIKDLRGEYLENQELQPDIEVYNDPASELRGEDKQIEAAVKELLKQTQDNK